MVNFAFVDRNKKIVSSDISINVLDEMRRERKILMALHDRAEEYIQIDLPSINIYDDNVVKKQNLATQLAIEDKLEFRNNLA